MSNTAKGYRYSTSADGKDIYIIELSAEDERQEDFDGEYVSENCICESITNINTGEEKEKAVLIGVMRNEIEYTKGEKIPGGAVWYVHDIKYLFSDETHNRYLFRADNGMVYRSEVMAYKNIEKRIRLFHCTFEEVAKEIGSSTEYIKRKMWEESLQGSMATYRNVINTANRIKRQRIPGDFSIYREIDGLILCVYDLSYEEVANRLNIPVEMLKTMICELEHSENPNEKEGYRILKAIQEVSKNKRNTLY